MPAFVLPSFNDAHLRLNVVGRERDGIVEQDEYQRACDELEAWVRSCRNPRTGNSVVAHVSRPHGDDPFETSAPAADLIVYFSEEADALEHPELGSVGPFPASRTGTHTPAGFALFVGNDIRPGEILQPHKLVDLPATILALAGVEPRRPIDGQPITSVIDASIRK
jgi:predicted AlkP superfamily phosphohydrolase/phosphomutase